jgi:hypothetical protein
LRKPLVQRGDDDADPPTETEDFGKSEIEPREGGEKKEKKKWCKKKKKEIKLNEKMTYRQFKRTRICIRLKKILRNLFVGAIIILGCNYAIDYNYQKTQEYQCQDSQLYLRKLAELAAQSDARREAHEAA